MTTLAELMAAYDWTEVMKYATGWSFADVDRVLFEHEGEPDEDHWLLLASLRSGGYGFVAAWCDYTGWGCQEGGEGGVVETLKAACDRLLGVVPSYYPERRAAVAAKLRSIEGVSHGE